MKCPCCTADVRIYDQTIELSCRDCGADIAVERKDCTIALRLIEASSLQTDPVPLMDAKRDELKTLQSEAAMVITVKRVAGVLGLLLGSTFAYTGFADASRDAAMGTSILVCAGALLGTVFCITRHTHKVSAQLAARIRTMSEPEEGVRDIV